MTPLSWPLPRRERLTGGLSYCFARVAVTTGAGVGYGGALAPGLARRGAHLARPDGDGEAAGNTAWQCRRTGGRARADTTDVTDRQAGHDPARQPAGSRAGSSPSWALMRSADGAA